MSIEAQDELDALEAEILGEGEGFTDEQPEPGRARSVPGEFIGPEKCGKICGTLSDLIAARKGDVFKLSPDEREQLGAALDPVLDKYMPKDGRDIGPELGLALVAFAIIVPRMGEEE